MRAARVRLLKQCSSMRALGRTAALHPEPDIVRRPKPLDRLAGSLRLNPQNSLTRYWRERDSNYLRAVDRRVCRKVVGADRHAEFPRKIVGGLRRRRPRRTTSGRRWRRRSTRWLHSVRLLRVPGTKGSNLSSSSGESGTNSVIGLSSPG